MNLRLVETRTFPGGVLPTRYETMRFVSQPRIDVGSLGPPKISWELWMVIRKASDD